jgi:hypothetical protein
MQINKLIRPSVGVDLSAIGGCSDIRIFVLKVIIAPKGLRLDLVTGL